MKETGIHYFYYLLNLLFVVLYIMSYFDMGHYAPIDLDVLDKVYTLFIALALIFFFNPWYKGQLGDFHKKIALSAGLLLLFTSSLSAIIKKTPIIGKIPELTKLFSLKGIFT
tara:strand:- start:163 stop:498 length:336 start_codon:yes stop_codon:yes gene_type:complete